MKIKQDLKELALGALGILAIIWILMWFVAGLTVALMELTK